MILAIVIFFISLTGIVVLFALKYWETRRGSVFLPSVRQSADQRAVELKGIIAQSGVYLGKLPPFSLHLARILIHTGALGAAGFARFLENRSHKLADFVSHKHRFEAHETRSEFLKKVSEHPMRDIRSNGAGKNGNGLERTTQNGQNS